MIQHENIDPEMRKMIAEFQEKIQASSNPEEIEELQHCIRLIQLGLKCEYITEEELNELDNYL